MSTSPDEVVREQPKLGITERLSHERLLEEQRRTVIARVPYQAWENVAYVAVTHRYSKPAFARRIFDRVHESRAQQDNEQWHLLILEELVEEEGRREPFIRYRVIPQIIAFAYYQLSGVHPASSEARDGAWPRTLLGDGGIRLAA